MPVVTETVEIAGRGLALFFEHALGPMPGASRLRLCISRPDGTEVEMEATLEFARKVPVGEAAVLLIEGATASDIPIGSVVHTLMRRIYLRLIDYPQVDLRDGQHIEAIRRTVEGFTRVHWAGGYPRPHIRGGWDAIFYVDEPVDFDTLGERLAQAGYAPCI